MRDHRLIKYAQALVNYSLYVKPNEWVVIRGSDLALPLIQECYREVLKAGAHPHRDAQPGRNLRNPFKGRQ